MFAATRMRSLVDCTVHTILTAARQVPQPMYCCCRSSGNRIVVPELALAQDFLLRWIGYWAYTRYLSSKL